MDAAVKQVLHAEQALLAAGWQRDVRVTLHSGRIAQIEVGVAARAGDERHGVLLPGMANLHSHAHQRGMAGMAEHRGASADSFWSWREAMYRFALAMTPEQLEAVASLAYVEMLEAGFTRVGEFHYLHHDPRGRPYANPAEMAVRLGAAAQRSGLGLTLLPVFYAHSAFGGAPPGAAQRRFTHDIDSYARLLEASRAALKPMDGATLGVAPHSLRAVTPGELAAVVALAGGAPVHIHIAEQIKEVEDCVAWSGARPVQWLLDHAPVDARWCLVHATHMDATEARRLAASGAVAGLCPITEANLGDGVFDAPAFVGAGGRYGIGSDSNVHISLTAELSLLEYSQRLAQRARNVLAQAGGSTGRALFDAALAGGAQALGTAPVHASGIGVGAAADLVSLDMGHPKLEGHTGDAILDAWVFTGATAIDSVWARGHRCVVGGRHVQRSAVERAFSAAMRALRSA